MPIILCGAESKLEALIWSVGVLFLPGNTFPSIAHLNLYQLASDARNLDNLLRLLSNCPRLETLVFAPTSLDIVAGMGPDRGPVPLKHLRALWILRAHVPVLPGAPERYHREAVKPLRAQCRRSLRANGTAPVIAVPRADGRPCQPGHRAV